MWDEQLDYYGDRFVRLGIGPLLDISFFDYLIDVDGWDHLLLVSVDITRTSH